MQTNVKKIITTTLTIVLIVSVIGYAYFRMRDLLNGPVVLFAFPKNGETLTKGFIDVSGTSKNISYLHLNGRKIFTDKNGDWKEKLLLLPGYNIIEADAKDRFGREVKKTLYIMYQEQQTY